MWQPIETAPHNEDILIASIHGVVSSAVFDSDENGGGMWLVREGLDDYFDTNPPVKWAPLPKP